MCPSVGEEGNEVAIDPSVVWPVGSYTVQSKISLADALRACIACGLKISLRGEHGQTLQSFP